VELAYNGRGGGLVCLQNLENYIKLGKLTADQASVTSKFISSFSIVIISNQAIKPRELEDWKKKIPSIAAAVNGSTLVVPLPNFTCYLLIASNCPLPYICSHRQRWVPETHAWDMV
jgi:hypothetical protein